LSFLAHTSIVIRIYCWALTIKPAGMNSSRRQQHGGADRMWYQWRARMSLHRNDIAMFGVDRTSRRRYSPLSVRPASNGRVDSAMAAPPDEPT
jgi:hypothetical protein